MLLSKPEEDIRSGGGDCNKLNVVGGDEQNLSNHWLWEYCIEVV